MDDAITVAPELMVDRPARHGWYVLYRGAAHGPISLERLMSFPPSEGMYVSRRGFDRWYPYREFSHLFQGLARLHVPQEQGQDRGVPRVVSNRLGPRPRRNDVWVQTPDFDDIDQRTWFDKAAKGHRRDHIKQRRRKKGLFGFAQDYIERFAELRIGKLREVGLSDIFTVVVTGGLFYAYWYGSVRREVRLHIGRSAPMTYYPAAFSLIPIFHMWAAYELAELVTKMERENGYQSIWPSLAALYAIFPPLAMLYIQGAVNRHWQAHMMHELRAMTEAPA